MKNVENNLFTEYTINGKIYRIREFDKLEKEDCYFLGYLLGDGGFNKPTHKRNARMFVSSINEDVVEWMKNRYQPDNSIDSRIPVNKTRNIKTNKTSYRTTFSSKLTPYFKKHGILGLKKDRTYHHIPKVHMRSFILGLLDADGYITWGHRKDRNRLWCNIGFTHQSYNALVKLQRFLELELNISSSVLPKSNEDCYILRFSSLKTTLQFLNWLYEEEYLPEHYNKNKYNKYILYKKASS